MEIAAPFLEIPDQGARGQGVKQVPLDHPLLVHWQPANEKGVSYSHQLKPERERETKKQGEEKKKLTRHEGDRLETWPQ